MIPGLLGAAYDPLGRHCMTAQMPEILLHRGERLDMAADPLGEYWKRSRRRHLPTFAFSSTACWRGYVGTWEFRDGFLCLVALDGWMVVDGRDVPASLAAALPWAGGCLRATWFSDVLRCPEGRLLCYSHGEAYGSAYERDRWFSINRGRLDAEHVTLNPPLPFTYRIEPDGRRTCGGLRRGGDEVPDPLDGRPFSDAHLVWGRPPPGEEGYLLGGSMSVRREAPDAP